MICVSGQIEKIAAYGPAILRNDHDLENYVKYAQLSFYANIIVQIEDKFKIVVHFMD